MKLLPAPRQLMERLTQIKSVQVRPSLNNGLEEAEETVTRDIPPLTGEENTPLTHLMNGYKNTIFNIFFN